MNLVLGRGGSGTMPTTLAPACGFSLTATLGASAVVRLALGRGGSGTRTLTTLPASRSFFSTATLGAGDVVALLLVVDGAALGAGRGLSFSSSFVMPDAGFWTLGAPLAVRSASFGLSSAIASSYLAVGFRARFERRVGSMGLVLLSGLVEGVERVIFVVDGGDFG